MGNVAPQTTGGQLEPRMWILPHLHISVLNILTPDRMRFLIRCHIQTVVHTCTPTHSTAQQSSGARLLWLKIRGGIINHKSLPLVKSGLSWCERSAVPAEQRQALAGWRARGACRGFPRHPEAYQSCGRWMDGRTMIRTRLWLRKGPPGRIFHW